MKVFAQSPTEDEFVQDPYPFYQRLRESGPMVWWEDYGMAMAPGYAEVAAVFKDRRFGRELPDDLKQVPPKHLEPFYSIENNSMLELEPPKHTRLRSLVMRAFTSRRIKGLQPEIEQLCHDLIDRFPDEPFDLLPSFAEKLPVIIIARLLGVPEEAAPDLLGWSHAMVAMYKADTSQEEEHSAAQASKDFTQFLENAIERKSREPADDLISHLIEVEEEGERLSRAELISTCILLLNAGHEATVHTLGNALKTLLEKGIRPTEDAAFVEEVLRHDPPLHMFTRYALEDVTMLDHEFKRGEQIGLLLASANRDELVYQRASEFIADRKGPVHMSFGAGIHFCVGAPLARMELQIALSVLFSRCPNLKLLNHPRFRDIFHFHGLDQLIVTK